MSASTSRSSDVFLTCNLCKAVNADGSIRLSEASGKTLHLPEGIAAAAGSFAILVDSSDEVICWSEEWSGHDCAWAIFEPWHAAPRPGDVYLWLYKNSLGDPDGGGGCVERFYQVVGKMFVFMDKDGEPELDLAMEKSNVLIVGRLVAVLDPDPDAGENRRALWTAPAHLEKIAEGPRCEERVSS